MGNPTRDVFSTKKHAIIMVGLPARGKSHIARSLKRYLNWYGHYCEVFNCGNLRRDKLEGNQSADFFDPDNQEGATKRAELATLTLDEMIRWFQHDNGVVGIYDATNNRRDRRRVVREKLEHLAVRVVFLESICTDADIIARNITETKVSSPDYKGMQADEAIDDFKRRIKMYEKGNQSMEGDEGSFIQIINVGKHLKTNNIYGYIPSKITSFLLNTHITRRCIYLSRHGESFYNQTGQIGGDSALTTRGRKYAQLLAQFWRSQFSAHNSANAGVPHVWTSQLQRAKKTVEHLAAEVCVNWRGLNEIHAGMCENLSYAEIARKYPEVARGREADKLHYRYPGGESYIDVIHRLEPIMMELERHRGDLFIVAHQAVLRTIYGYLTGLQVESVPHVDIPLHTVYKLTMTAYEPVVEMFDLDAAVDGGRVEM